MTRATIKETVDGVEMYKLKNAKYPGTLEEVVAANFLKEMPADAWGKPLIYWTKGRSFDVGSYGADGLFGGIDEHADLWTHEITR